MEIRRFFSPHRGLIGNISENVTLRDHEKQTDFSFLEHEKT